MTTATKPTTVARPDTFRQSLLARHDKCPHSALLYLKHDGGPDSHAKTRGSLFHRFMEQATTWMIEEGEPTMPGEVATEFADAIMAENLSEPLSAEEQDVVRQCAWNWAEATVIDLEALVGVEVDVELEIGGVMVTGRIDRVEASGSSLFLRDAKTALHVMNQDDADHSFQRLLYSLAVLDGIAPGLGSLGAGITDVWFTFEYPRYRTEEGPLITREAVSTRQELAEFRRSLERNVAAFEHSFAEDDWPAVPGSWCSECAAQSECPLSENLRPIVQIESVEEAEEAFSQLLSLDRQKAPLQKGLREWVKENEQPVYQGDYAFAATVTRSTPINKENVEKAALVGGRLDAAQIYDPPKTTTKYAKRKITKEERDAGPG